jgi:hypothetical protein
VIPTRAVAAHECPEEKKKKGYLGAAEQIIFITLIDRQI